MKKSFLAQKRVNRRISLRLLQLVMNNPYSVFDTDMASLADLIDVSHEQLSYYFKSVLMEKYSVWRNCVRIEKAKQLLLLNSSMPLKRVAEQSGFSDLSNFRRTFKAVTGLYPSEWLKKVLVE